jgi:hypothetical protein
MHVKNKRRIYMVTPTNPAHPAPGAVQKPTVVASKTATPVDASAPAGADGGQAEEGKKKKAAKTGVARPRLARPDEAHVITVLRPNAKTGKSGQRFDQVRTGMTVKEYVDLMTKEPFNRKVGQAYHTLRWDTDPNRKLLNIGPVVVPIPEPEPPKEKKTKAKEEKAAAPAA